MERLAVLLSSERGPWRADALCAQLSRVCRAASGAACEAWVPAFAYGAPGRGPLSETGAEVRAARASCGADAAWSVLGDFVRRREPHGRGAVCVVHGTDASAVADALDDLAGSGALNDLAGSGALAGRRRALRTSPGHAVADAWCASMGLPPAPHDAPADTYAGGGGEARWILVNEEDARRLVRLAGSVLEPDVVDMTCLEHALIAVAAASGRGGPRPPTARHGAPPRKPTAARADSDRGGSGEGDRADAKGDEPWGDEGPRIAVALHMYWRDDANGDSDGGGRGADPETAWPDMRDAVCAVLRSGLPCDVYVNLSADTAAGRRLVGETWGPRVREALGAAARDAARARAASLARVRAASLHGAAGAAAADACLSRISVVVSENRGLDIGGFLRALDAMVHSGRPYDLLLKLHTKSSDGGRANLVRGLCATPGRVRDAVDAFARRPSLGMAGPAGLVLADGHEFCLSQNEPYLGELAERLGIRVPLGALRFVAGSMFWARAGPLLDAMRSLGLAALLRGLNTPQSLDWRWYCLAYPELRLRARDDAERHWRTEGRRSGRRNHGYCGVAEGPAMRDGMVEHAWERALGWLYVDRGLAVEELPAPQPE